MLLSEICSLGLRGPKPKSPRTDYQRNEVYDWEDQFYTSKYSTADPRHFSNILRSIGKAYGVPIPKVKAMPRGKFYDDAAAVCDAPRGYLYVRRGYRSILILCHEMAHWILDHYGYPDMGHHGPRFVGVYLWLLASAQVIPLEVSKRSCTEFGLDYRDPIEECSPDNLKRYLEV